MKEEENQSKSVVIALSLMICVCVLSIMFGKVDIGNSFVFLLFLAVLVMTTYG